MTMSVLSFTTSEMARSIFSSFSGSANAVASSKMTTGASFKIALASETLCRSPPESALPQSPANVSMPFGSPSINSMHCAFSAAESTSSRVAEGLPARIFS